MAASRGRTFNTMGQAFTPFYVDGGSAPAGQPVMIRTQGIPTGPGYRDRPGKWNAVIVDWFRRLRPSRARGMA